MNITRRHLAVAGVLALGGGGLWRSSSVVAESADEAAVAQAVEVLQKQGGTWKLLARQSVRTPQAT
jgi:hypothetical protein